MPRSEKLCIGGDYVPGAAPKRKGSAGERELVNILKEAGIEAQRVPLSGATENYPGDVYLPEIDKRIEVKRRKEGMKAIYKWLAQSPDVSYVAFRVDRQPWLVAMPIEEFIALIKGE